MGRVQIQGVNVERAKLLGGSGYIEDDILLIDELNKAPIPREPRRMDMIVVAICLRGKAQYTIDTREQLVRKNDLLIISDRHILDNFMSSPDLEGLCIIISTTFFKEIIQNISDVSALFLFSRNHPVVSLSEQEVETFVSYYRYIKKKMTTANHHFRRDIVRTLLLAMFYDLSNVIYRIQQISNQHMTRAEIIFTRFIKLVEENFRRERRVGWYAEQLCITPKHLSGTVKKVSNRTSNEWIDSYLTLEIRVMLKNTTKTIKEISEELNFSNQSFLGRYFREQMGISPSQYRKS